MNKNLHIEKYLENYLTLDKPEFAVLLSGKWGSGKTYFINEFIKKQEENKENIKFIKVSLFEISNKDDLQHKIIMKSLGMENERGFFAKGTKVGTKIINSFGKKLGLSIYDIPIEEILNKIDKKIIFIFDDLERANISLHEVLGYINNYVEILKFHVIVLANEVEINDKKYQKFKEKVIGKTFEVQHDFDDVLSSFLTDELKVHIVDNKDLIKNIYYQANYNNLRHIKQILLDFEYFIKLVDEKYLENKKFMSILINNFFALSIELKSGSLKEMELYNKPDYNFNKDKEKSNVEKIYEKYNIDKNLIFSGKGWVWVLLKNSISKEMINEVFSKLSFFIEEKKNEQASWVKLWYYRELENDEFDIAKQDVLDKFNNCEYEVPEHFLHVISLLIYFVKKGLCDLKIIDIEKQVNKCIDKYKETSIWKEKLIDGRMDFNNTGLRYMSSDSEEFSKLYQLVIEKNKKIYHENEKIIEKNDLIEFLSAIKQNNEEMIKELLLNKYKEKPVLKNLSTKDFLDLINNIDNKSLTQFSYILHRRYPDNHYMDNEKIYCYYLKEELEFWKEVDKELKLYLDKNDSKTLSIFLLKEFYEYVVKDLVKKLEKCNK